MAKIAFKFKTRTIDYNTLQESVAKIGHSNHIYKYVPRFHRRQDRKKIQFKRERFIPAFLTMKKIHLQNKTSLQRFGESKKTRLLIKSFFWTCFPPISIDKNGEKDIFSIKGVLYCCFNAMKLPFSWRIEMFSKTEPILIKYVWYEI